MFTGLIASLGTLRRVENMGAETRFTIESRPAFEDIVRGESIAVNGVCLSVEEFSGGTFSVYASGETLSKTTLSGFATGRTVNLERALAVGDRLGGHLVSGHVDCIATVAEITPAGQSKRLLFKFPKAFGPLVVPKGSVCLDGVSLTVNECGGDYLTVNIIPETQRQTAMADWTPGAKANMEADIVGKYIQRLTAPYLDKGNPGNDDDSPTGLTVDYLKTLGF